VSSDFPDENEKACESADVLLLLIEEAALQESRRRRKTSRREGGSDRGRGLYEDRRKILCFVVGVCVDY